MGVEATVEDAQEEQVGDEDEEENRFTHTEAFHMAQHLRRCHNAQRKEHVGLSVSLSLLRWFATDCVSVSLLRCQFFCT